MILRIPIGNKCTILPALPLTGRENGLHPAQPLADRENGLLHAQDANTLDFLSVSGTRLRRSPSLRPQK